MVGKGDGGRRIKTLPGCGQTPGGELREASVLARKGSGMEERETREGSHSAKYGRRVDASQMKGTKAECVAKETLQNYDTNMTAHHAWLVPTPFAALAFHPLDGYAQSLPYQYVQCSILPAFTPVR